MFEMNGVGVFEGGKPKKTLFESRGRKIGHKIGRRRRPRYVAFTAVKPVEREPIVMTAEPIPRSDQWFIDEETKFRLKRDPWTGRPTGVLKFKPEKYKRFRHELEFKPRRLLRFPGRKSPDIRPLGPYELPDYTSPYPSAAGLSWLGAEEAKAQPKEEWWQTLIKAGTELVPAAYAIYQERKDRKRPAAPPPAAPPPPAPVFVQTQDKGMSGTTLALIIGGGVVVLGLGAILLLRK